MESLSRPEPMNATSNHPKVKLAMSLPSKSFVAGRMASGKLEMECKADKGLGISTMMVELFAIQELTSRDHSATSTFIHGRRLFQGPGLPPSNAVQPHPLVGDPPLPQHYYQARKGKSTFFYRFEIPSSSPASISFGSNLARIRYELKASVQVHWKGEKQLVTERKEIEVHESYEEDFSREEPERTIVGENGKIWAQGRVVGGILVSGESACVELEVKNHSNKRNTGLTVTLMRMLHLPNAAPSSKAPLQITDTLVTVPFKGQEYVIPPGAEGVASLVFEVPHNAKSARGGMFDGDESENRTTHALFEVRCFVSVKMTMGIGNKDINIDLPASIVHPSALPELPPPPANLFNYPQPPSPSQTAFPNSPYAPHTIVSSPGQAVSPVPFAHPAYVYIPPPGQYFSPPEQGYHPGQQYYYPPPPAMSMYAQSPPSQRALSPVLPAPIQRPSSTGPSADFPGGGQLQAALLPLETSPGRHHGGLDAEEGKGQRATRISHHLRESSRHRSVSPQAHRYPLPEGTAQPNSPPSGRALPVPPVGITPRAVQHPGPLSPSGLRASAPQRINLANLPPAGEPVPVVLHSPRPMPSPKLGMSPSSSGGLKSERVGDLERMADEVGKKSKDLSADIPPEARSKVLNNLGTKASGETSGDAKEKTLPKVPTEVVDYFAGAPLASDSVSQRKDKRVSPLSSPLREEPIAAHSTPSPPTDGVNEAPPAPVISARKSAAQLKTPRPLSSHPTSDPATKTLHKAKSNNQTHNQLSPFLTPDSASGLDALEKRLLEQVGTKKIRPDALDLDGPMPEGNPGDGLPIPIPRKRTESKEDASLHDSAISSLSLGVCDIPNGQPEPSAAQAGLAKGEPPSDGFDAEAEDERTHRGKSRMSDTGSADEPGFRKEKKMRELEPAVTVLADEGSGSGKGSKEKRRKGNDSGGNYHKKKEASKGRVAEWLGAIEPADPPEGFPPVSPAKPEFSVAANGTDKPKQEELESKAEEQPKATPNPRSSGFVAKGTFKRDNTFDYGRTAKEEAKRVADLWSAPANANTSRDILPPSADDPWKSIRSPALAGIPDNKAPKAFKDPPKKVAAPSARFPLYPPPRAQDFNMETKYDVRSARGGRGGKVTAVAAIWAQSDPESNGEAEKAPKKRASVAKPTHLERISDVVSISSKGASASKKSATPPSVKSDSESSGKDSRDRLGPLRKPGGLPLKGMRAAAPALPALVSSSHAKPTISTTASLARPSPTLESRNEPTAAGKVGLKSRSPPAVASKPVGLSSQPLRASRTNSDVGRTPLTSPAPVKGEMAFGQARLRDLIKKYQGQAG